MKALITDGLLKKIVYAFISLVLALNILLFERIIRFKWRAIHPPLPPTQPVPPPALPAQQCETASSPQLPELASPFAAIESRRAMHFALPRGSCGVGCGSVRPCYGKHARRGCYCYEVTLATISWTLEILSVLSAMLTVLLMAVIVIYAAGPHAKIHVYTDAQLTAWAGPVPATTFPSPCLPGSVHRPQPHR